MTPCTAGRQAPLSSTIPQSLLKFMSIESVMHPTISSSVVPFSSCLQSFPASVFSSESALHIRWPKHWSFSFSISPFSEHPRLISFRMGWWISLHSKALKSLLQHHSSKASILLCSAFFIVQLSHLYMTIGKTIALTRQTLLAN